MNEMEHRSAVSGLRITPDGTIDKWTLVRNHNDSLLQALYAAIGCHLVECVGLTEDVDMWIDEEGAFTESVNRAATVMVEHIISKDGRTLLGPIHGTAVLLGIDQRTGESLDLDGVGSLTGEQLAQLQNAARSM